jgi:Regulator of chromosome condensation (RCC1) repeat
MSEVPQPATQVQPLPTTSALKLYVYGSCESDQYYHPSRGTESRRPICLSEVQEFKVNEGDDEKPVEKIIQNPFLREEIYQITCGALHTVVLTTEGTVYTFGCND